MNMHRVNNYRMGAYAAFAAGLINLRYQTGSDSNLSKSLVLIIPGFFIFAISFTNFGKKWMQTQTAAAMTIAGGGLLLLYSFIL
jgi:hypothetical protein